MVRDAGPLELHSSKAGLPAHEAVVGSQEHVLAVERVTKMDEKKETAPPDTSLSKSVRVVNTAMFLDGEVAGGGGGNAGVLEPGGSVGLLALALALLPFLAALRLSRLGLSRRPAKSDLTDTMASSAYMGLYGTLKETPWGSSSALRTRKPKKPGDEGAQLAAQSDMVRHTIDSAGLLVELLTFER